MRLKIKVKNKENRNFYYIKGSENVNGKYEDRFKAITLRFMDKSILEDNTSIEVTDGFFTFNRKDGTDYMTLVVKEYIKEGEEIELSEDDLPF